MRERAGGFEESEGLAAGGGAERTGGDGDGGEGGGRDEGGVEGQCMGERVGAGSGGGVEDRCQVAGREGNGDRGADAAGGDASVECRGGAYGSGSIPSTDGAEGGRARGSASAADDPRQNSTPFAKLLVDAEKKRSAATSRSTTTSVRTTPRSEHTALGSRGTAVEGSAKYPFLERREWGISSASSSDEGLRSMASSSVSVNGLTPWCSISMRPKG
mmetsp:Transcript_15773/g.37776  ORF Transcript_15773/g.37776 Transcript_15773/m.37776 type:complete len:216 (+) Transcript_15773:2333-2980(+)